MGYLQKQSINEGDIVTKFYFAKRIMVWEITIDTRLKKKIEIHWDEISAISAKFNVDQCSVFQVEVIYLFTSNFLCKNLIMTIC